eukprot:scaffold14699_cov170-Amphora_coffeaeformis.AAC.16
MRVEAALVGLLSLSVAVAADGVPVQNVRRGEDEQKRRGNIQRRAKKSKSTKKSMKSSKKDYYEPPPSIPDGPVYRPPTDPSPPNYQYPGGKGKGASKKKYKDPDGHYYGDRLMYSGSYKGKGKGGYYTWPPFPSPRPTPAPNGIPTTRPPTTPPANEGCSSLIANSIGDQVPQVITRNPPRCCDGNPATAVFITHAEPDDSTFSGFEPFWDAVYAQILQTTTALGVCFVMTGYDPGAGTMELPLSLLDAIGVASTIPEVPSIMTTDPTSDVALMQAIRGVSSNSLLSSIGVFNAGYNNIIVESIVSGQDRLPFVGYLSDAEFGTEAGRVSLRLLDGTPAVPLCYNARLGITRSIAERCASFYAEVTNNPVLTEDGVACSSESDPQELANQISAAGANVVWSHVDCCRVVLDAVEIVREQGTRVIVGCQDLDTTGGQVDFVTQQPIELQAYQAASWASFPVLQAQRGKDGRGDQFFPSLQTLVNTGIFSVILL